MRLTIVASLVLILAAVSGVRAEDFKPGAKDEGGSALSAKVVVNKAEYELAPGQRGNAFRKKVSAPDTDKPEPPAVDLTLVLTNTTAKPVTFMLGSDSSRLEMKLHGPEALTVASNRIMTLEFRNGEAVTLAPGATHEMPIRSLASGIRNIGEFSYWTEPGEYALTVSYVWADADQQPHTATADPVKLTVSAK